LCVVLASASRVSDEDTGFVRAIHKHFHKIHNRITIRCHKHAVSKCFGTRHNRRKACLLYHTRRCGRPQLQCRKRCRFCPCIRQCRKRCHTGFKLSKWHSCKCIPNKSHRCHRQAASKCRRRHNRKACVSKYTRRCFVRAHFRKINQSHRCHIQAASKCRKARHNRKACVWDYTRRCDVRAHFRKIHKSHRCDKQAASKCRKARYNRKACVSKYTRRCLISRPQCRKKCPIGFKISRYSCKCVFKITKSHKCKRKVAIKCRRASSLYRKGCVSKYTRRCLNGLNK